jgi:hypothetical protein
MAILILRHDQHHERAESVHESLIAGLITRKAGGDEGATLATAGCT